MTEELQKKYEGLLDLLKGYGCLAVAFSSGVDSSFLLYATHEALGDSVLAITASSSLFPRRELEESRRFCGDYGIEQVELDFPALDVEGIRENPKDRCYLCKRALMGRMKEEARIRGFDVVAEGSNLDDDGDYRPGFRAIQELWIVSPLRDAGFTKQDIRDMSKHLGLPTWDRVSMACLASRFVYGEMITDEKLRMVEEAEQLLLDMGFRQERVRLHGDMARIEVAPSDIPKLAETESRERIIKNLKTLGFTYVTLDLAGYRVGSMNEGL